MEDSNTRYYIRFTLAQRLLHGVIIVTFLGLALTGMPLRFSSSPWMLAIARGVGGFGAVLFFHKFCALALTIAFLIHLANVVYRVVMYKEYGLIWGPRSMVPRLKDIQDFFGSLRWFVHLGPRPKYDRFTYWDKFDYWAVFWGMAIIGFSGYAMWFSSFFARFIPGSWLNIALLIHGEEAILAVGFIFAIHFFNTHLRPENFPMDLTIFTGRLSEEEFKYMHPEEWERLVASGGLKDREVGPPPLWMKNFSRIMGVTAVLAGLAMLVILVVAFVGA